MSFLLLATFVCITALAGLDNYTKVEMALVLDNFCGMALLPSGSPEIQPWRFYPVVTEFRVGVLQCYL